MKKHGELLLVNIDSDDIAKEVDKICRHFLHLRNISYFQFKRIYKDNTFILLANNPKFFNEFPEDEFIVPTNHFQIHTRQNFFCFWDETLSKDQLCLLKEKQGIYHGFTILSRRKVFYDCITFAMLEPHPSPAAYYFHSMKELQKFSEVFPTISHQLIKKAPRRPLNTSLPSQEADRKHFFLPKRSTRFYIGENVKNYT